MAVNSSGHVFVFSRSNSAHGPAFGAAAAQLLEFDQNGKFVREIGKGLYAWSLAHSVRIDQNDNIWAIDKGSDMIVRFNPAGPRRLGVRAQAGIGRRRRAAGASRSAAAARRRHVPSADRRGLGLAGQHLHHRRLRQLARRQVRQERRLGEVMGTKGTGPGQFSIPHAIAIDRHDNVYVGDRTNHRIQVFDTEGKFMRMFTIDVPPDSHARRQRCNTRPAKRSSSAIGAPNSICITPGSHSGAVRRRDHLSRTHLQGRARRQGARRDRPVGTQPRAVLRRARARVPVGARDLRRRDVELARAEAAAAVGTRARHPVLRRAERILAPRVNHALAWA